ncbi:MAG: N-acetylmuramoyl-L-alanine amidase [Clostridiaceae bacterium]|nr:N-acetylmuramoyl-L-alanine amidase [Clostridiaceae bacterium]
MLNFAKLGFTPLLILDDGHGPETPGKRTPPFPDGAVIRENTFNKAVIDLLEVEAKRLGYKTLQVAPEDKDVALATRSNRANKAYADLKAQLGNTRGMMNGKAIAIYISQHYNAMKDTWDGSTANGMSIHILGYGGEAAKIATSVLKYLAQGTPQTNRGIKVDNFHVLRETDMPAILIEAGFMDDPEDAALMSSPAYHKEVVSEILQGIGEYYGVGYIPEAGKHTPQEEAVQAAINAGIIKDRDHWLAVLNGKRPIDLRYLMIAFMNTKGLKIK